MYVLEIIINFCCSVTFKSVEMDDVIPVKKGKGAMVDFYDSSSINISVDLPLYFPRDQPTLTFQSVYHFTNSGQLYSQAQKNYPYSPRWDGNEMAKRAK